jgi:uncharacterized SAM-dependent methyltransferase
MSSLAHVAIHSSQFPEIVQRDLRESLRTRQLNPKFLYDSVKQTRKWLALHQAYSPSRTDADCARAYDRSFKAAAKRITARRVRVIGLGCGGGQKDARLLRLLREAGKEVHYTPADVSTAMVLVARQSAIRVIPETNCRPLVCDLATADDLPSAVEQAGPLPTGRGASAAARLITCFGIIPNLEASVFLPRLAALVRRGDWLLFSANLAPGPDYAAGIQRVLPLYNNALTRDWLMTCLIDLGVENSDGRLRFSIEDDPAGGGLKRIAAHFHFHRRRMIMFDREQFIFGAGESIRLFISYRHTPVLVRQLLARHGLQTLAQWLPRSGEEGVFLAGRKID